jgi:large subunit ribosomal protein L23
MAELNDYQVILRPITTEKSLKLASVENKYTFEVDVRANKLQIAEAVSYVFDVDVDDVHVINTAPRFGRAGRKTVKRRGSIKKAVVTVPTGQRIDEFGV